MSTDQLDISVSPSIPTFTIQSQPASDILRVNGNNGSPIFSIKPDGEFVPGPDIDLNKAITHATKMFYEQITIFGKSLAQTTMEQSQRIKELEAEIKQLKNGTSN